MLEACYAGFNIEGCDINEKTCKYVRENLSHFNYISNVNHRHKRCGVAIIDLPYNLLTKVSDNNTLHIIESTAKSTD
jgi:tRNA (guanine10-N2)-dimethyltransferase